MDSKVNEERFLEFKCNGNANPDNLSLSSSSLNSLKATEGKNMNREMENNEIIGEAGGRGGVRDINEVSIFKWMWLDESKSTVSIKKTGLLDMEDVEGRENEIEVEGEYVEKEGSENDVKNMFPLSIPIYGNFGSRNNGISPLASTINTVKRYLHYDLKFAYSCMSGYTFTECV